MGIVSVLSVLAIFVGADPAALESRRELFVDDWLIERLEGAALRLQHPIERETVLRFDAPWEGRYCAYVTVFQDGDRIRMYYRGLPEAGRDGSSLEATCYAESLDGRSFVKPQLGLHEMNGARDNNVVLTDMAPFTHNFAPFLDDRPDVPAEARYKGIAGLRTTGLHTFTSADGLRWEKTGVAPVITDGAFDSQNVAFWSGQEQQYVCYFRTSYQGVRSVSRSTSPDFEHWSAPEPMVFGDRPLEHLYTNQTLPYYRAPHLYVAVAARFMPGRTVLSEEEARAMGIQENYWKDISDSVLMTSRGGTRYDRTFMEGFIRPGIGLENWSSRTNYPAWGIVATGEEEMSLYVQHNYGQPSAHLVRYSLRPDGFVALHAPYEGGTALTRPFTFTGSQLYLNFSTSAAGFVRVELQDAAGNVIPGFSAEACTEIIGNDLDRVVRWEGGGDLSALEGTPVRLKLALKDADCFSMQFR